MNMNVLRKGGRHYKPGTAGYIHWKICQHHRTGTVSYIHQPKARTENEAVTILWDMQIHTDKYIKANKQDIIIKNMKEKSSSCTLTNMSVPSDRNVSLKEASSKNSPNTKILKSKSPRCGI